MPRRIKYKTEEQRREAHKKASARWYKKRMAESRAYRKWKKVVNED